jgi:hypothetical protein
MKPTRGVVILMFELACNSRVRDAHSADSQPLPLNSRVHSERSLSAAVVGRPTLWFCSEDLSRWSPTHHSPFVPVSVATRALRPAIAGLQHRLCNCAANATRIPAALHFVFAASPNAGRTEVNAGGTDEFDELASCVGRFVAFYPRFEFRGDDLDCDSGAKNCTSPPASFVAPFQVDLNGGT